MRLFIAATLAPEQQQKLEQAQQLLRQNSEKISLTKAENLHLTLHFLGETEAADAQQLLAALRKFEFPSREKLRSRVAGYGYFKRRDGDLIYADLAVTPEVFQLQENLGQLLCELGFHIDKRGWKAHVTLARRTRLAVSRRQLEAKLPLQKQSYAFSRLALFKSEFTQQGMLYTSLFHY